MKVRYAEFSENNPRRQEEQEFLGLGGRVGAPEEMPDERQTADQGHLADVHPLLRDDNTTDDHRAAVGNSDLGFGGLRIQRGNALHARNTSINLRVFDQHVHEDRAFGRDLRGYFQLQNGVNELAPRLVFNGRLLVPLAVTKGGGVVSTLLTPTVESPLNHERPPVVCPAKPSWVPISRAKERDADTTRASISTCCDLRSS